MSNSPWIFNTSIILLIITIVTFIIYFTVIFPAAVLTFTETESCWSFYNFKRILEIIKTNKKRYIFSALLCLLISLIYNSIQSLNFQSTSMYSFIVVIIMCAIVLTYLIFVNCYIIANSDK